MKGKPSKYISKTPDLEDWIRDFAKYLDTNPDRNTIQYPKSFASGYAKVFRIEEGFTCRMVDYQLNADFAFGREPSEQFYLIIYFYRYTNCEQMHHSVNGKSIVENFHHDYSSLLMTNSFTKQQLKLSKGTIVKGLTIQLSENWLLKKLALSPHLNLKILKQKEVSQTLIRPVSQMLLNEIFSKPIMSPVPELFIGGRVMQLLDIFLSDLFKNGLNANILPVSSKDVHNILKVENFLLQSYKSGFPSINSLSRMAYMSNSKLKQVFKKAFGMSPFEFFQKNRMARARQLLLSNVHSVTEVGKILGYQNLSNFSIAFKKEFGYLPKDIARG